MKAFSTLCAAVVSVATFSAAIAPVQASSIQNLVLTQNNAQLIDAHDHRRRHHDRYYDDRFYDDHFYDDRRGPHLRFENRRGGFYLNGYRGVRERHRGWRHYNGYWFPPAAFSFSITIR